MKVIRTLIPQMLHFDHMGNMSRREAVAALARVRQRLEASRNPQVNLPDVDPVQLLFDICREMGLDQLEIIEAVGAHNVVDHLYQVGLQRAHSESEFSRWLATDESVELTVDLERDAA